MLMLSGYDVVERIHAGRNSEVYRAIRLSDRQSVILKSLMPLRPPPERVARFKREFETLRRVAGESVVAGLVMETDQSRWVIVEEDFGGISLDRLLRDGPLSVEDVLTCAVSVAEALHHVHAAHVIHKDINPSNIVWNRTTRQLKLIDFGIATVLSRENPVMCSPTLLEGTLSYISPEQTGRVSSPVDFRTDFYSLGVTLYELASGHPPFVSSDPLELVHCHIAQTPLLLSKVRPELPPVLSEVVKKLLAKAPEARYQSTLGLLHDLRRCRDEHHEGRSSSFEVGTRDFSSRFLIPQRLYGRDDEIATLFGAFAAIAEEHQGTRDSTAPILLVAGASGIGKSALVQELYRPLTTARGYFITGKFDQYQRNIPYSAVVQAFRGLVRELLTQSEERLRVWREHLLEALGTSAKAIIDVIPEVSLIIGPQPDLQSLGPTEERNRFNRVFRKFVRVFAQPEHPVVLFLDDLQWADSASLRLIELMLTDDRLCNLLLIGAYRDNEVGPAHPLTFLIETLRDEDIDVGEITLQPLTTANVTELITDMLGTAPDRAAPLAALIRRNTEGNPLYVTELLRALHDQELIRFDSRQASWTWELASIESEGVTKNILQLMIAKLRRLSGSTQRAVQIAACVGASFDLRTLSIILERSLRDTFAELLPAIQAGVLVTTSETDLMPGEDGSGGTDVRFFHDRVQQAAYASFDDDRQRVAVHLRIGRLLLANISDDERDEQIFNLVEQFNRGRECLDDEAELVQLAHLNLEAGHKARASTAYSAAVEYLEVGREVLPPNSWERHYELSMDIIRELAIAEFLDGGHEASDRWSHVALEHAKTDLEKANIYHTLAGQCTMSARYGEALDVVRTGLTLLGIDVPALEDMGKALRTEHAEIEARLEEVPISSLIDHPPTTDPRIIAATRLFQTAVPAAFYTDLNLMAWVVAKPVNLWLQHGNPPDSLDLYATYGDILVKLFQEYQKGYEFAVVGVTLSERAGNAQDKCRSCFFLANWILPWVRPLAETKAINNAGFEAGLESGELVFGGYTITYRGMNDFYCGEPLDRVLKDVSEYLAWTRKVKNTFAGDNIEGQALVIANLAGVADRHEFAFNGMDDARYIEMCKANMTNMGLAYYHVLKLQAHFLYGEYDAALAAALTAEELLPYITGNIGVAEHAFYSALTRCALHADLRDGSGSSDPDEATQCWEKIEEYHGQLGRWAESCPQNFRHMHALVTAEMARVQGRSNQAIEPYEVAIESALANGFVQDVALGYELAGRYWRRRGREELFRNYITTALYRYQLWGAKHKIAMLKAEFPWISDAPRHQARSISSNQTAISVTTTRLATALDLDSVIKASHAISGEIVLEKLLSKLMRLVLENAGAQRGALIIDTDGRLLVQASATMHADDGDRTVHVDVLAGALLEEIDIAHSIVNYAARVRQSVILNDAVSSGNFTMDEYIVTKRPLSLLCLPLTRHGDFFGLLYLENNLTVGAFTEERIEVLRLLSSQFAISFENATLYNKMEQKVEKRTEELKRSNQEVEAALHRLKTTQRQLVHSQKMASLGQLTAGIAHEINNPLNFVQNFAEVSTELIEEILAAHAGDPDLRVGQIRETLTDLEESMRAINNHSVRASGIVHGMLQHARGHTGAFEATEMNGFVRQYVKLAQSSFESRTGGMHVELTDDYGEGVGTAKIVPDDLGRVLINLLNNAFDAVKDRAKSEPSQWVARIRVTTAVRGGDVEVRISDNGSGVADGVRDKIFEPFFTTKAVHRGIGVGLSLSHDIVVEGHGGTLQLEEGADAEGATFVMRVPREAKEALARAERSPARDPRPS